MILAESPFIGVALPTLQGPTAGSANGAQSMQCSNRYTGFATQTYFRSVPLPPSSSLAFTILTKKLICCVGRIPSPKMGSMNWNLVLGRKPVTSS